MKLKCRTLLEALVSIRDEGVTNIDMGICGNVFRLFEQSYEDDGVFDRADKKLDDLFDLWTSKAPRRSAINMSYPVGGGTEYAWERERGGLWNNVKRYELLHWLISQLENEA